MAPYVLQDKITPDDQSWKFGSVPQASLQPPARHPKYGKLVRFTAQQSITLDMGQVPTNRILNGDDPKKFILVLFSDLRFPDTPLRVTAEYISRFLKAGFFLNNIQYRFYHHSNSQLKSRSCFLRQANTDTELDARIYRLGDFERIMNVAKRAKRIGLLFSAAQIDYQLDPQWIADIPDIKVGDELFSDGCGLISRNLSIQLARAKQIVFRGTRYTPCVFQIRYLGYKGVLMLHPELDKEKKNLAQFRQSMKKFTVTDDRTFSVVGFSRPYAFGRLNNDIIVLLSSLGITNDKLLAKQEEYFKWITAASHDFTRALDFVSCTAHDAFESSMQDTITEENRTLIENVLLKGLDDESVSKRIRKLQMSEIARFRHPQTKKPKSSMIILKSRLLFGVCDPFCVLKEGQVHIRITTGRRGVATPIHGDVLVVRNPCLHPGDCLKLRAVNNDKLSHLVDCIVFATVARPGHQSAPAMSSGGDLDGDQFLVCWDPDLVPSVIAESYDYPGSKERASLRITRADLADHFASYNNAGLAKVAHLHQKWARCSPNGALSSQCQELNALHSQSVDGARIKIPERLLTPPESTEPYILDLLAAAADQFSESFMQNVPSKHALMTASAEEAQQLVLQLFKSQQNAVSEYELFTMAHFLGRQHGLDIRPYLPHVDVGALTTQQKYALSSNLNLTPQDDPYIWNSLYCSDILTARDLYQKELNRPYSLQRLYSSKAHGLATFFRYLRMATQDYTRKLLVMKTEERFAVGIFMRGLIPWDEDPEVENNVVVCPFMPQTSSTVVNYKPCTKGYRLHCSEANFQLYKKQRDDTFVFITRPPAASGAEVATSIALQKISTSVQKQLGRVNRKPVTAIELHVVSNRDRVAHQLFDLWFEHIPTESRIKRLAHETVSYTLNSIEGEDWTKPPTWLKALFVPKLTADAMEHALANKTTQELNDVMEFSLKHHAEDELFWTFRLTVSRLPLGDIVQTWVERWPPLAFVVLKVYPPSDEGILHVESTSPAFGHSIVRNIIRSANALGMACLVALEKLSTTIAQLPIANYLDILMLTSLCVRSEQLVQEVLLVLNDCREPAQGDSDVLRYAHKHALAVAFDRAEEAADECPCDDNGKPKKQRVAPTMVKLLFVPDQPTQANAHVRIDAKSSVRLHSHVRLQAASKPVKGWIEFAVLDGIVVQAAKGELKIELLYPPPPEMDQMDWKMYNAGSIATSKAMMDAILRLVEEGSSCCSISATIISPLRRTVDEATPPSPTQGDEGGLNPSQIAAVESCSAALSLILGPPGTGKTTVVVRILRQILQNIPDESKILVTASTHNAVDNVLERFVKLNNDEHLIPDEQILRVATDHSKVSSSLQNYTVDARVGGDTNENNRLVKKALTRVKAAILVFTTCAGAGLGVMRKIDFDIVLIDEASQVTEPCALIPLVKGCQRAVLVGDHHQLRPMVRRMAQALQFDTSLFERLYGDEKSEIPGVKRTMLNVQYRFPKELAAFPSKEWYGDQLGSARQNSAEVLAALEATTFPWPRVAGVIVPTIFVQCSSEEDMGGRSKGNAGQAELIKYMMPMLTTGPEGQNGLKITVLSPYTKQVQALKSLSLASSTIDAFQGRESDIIVFSAVRSNVAGDIGFLDDERRLNVMWTRAKLALIIVGDRRTMETNELWKRAINACTEVKVELPSAES